MASLFTEMTGDILYPQQRRKSTGREGKGAILDLGYRNMYQLQQHQKELKFLE